MSENMVSSIQLPNGTLVEIADAEARSSIADLIENGKTLPDVSASDNGKILRVVEGSWSAATIPEASGVSF